MKTAAVLLDSYRKLLLWLFMAVIVFSIIFYMYFVNETVRNVVLRQDFENQVTDLNSKVANLEFEYISHAHSVDMVLASSMGFKEVREPIFIARKETLSLLSPQE